MKNMNDEIFERIKEFTRKESFVNDVTLTRETKLEDDLGISGADGVEFVVAYGKAFNVNVSNFKADDYFEAEGGQFISKIAELLMGRREYHPKRKELTLGDLEVGVIKGEFLPAEPRNGDPAQGQYLSGW